ncbi:MAG: 1,6-anhydro-N-acetylmuramyl-L-alanine amidase AmpD [Proteobacteria bacterium]|nr:1,6-anhydro-N-acetylmuramyl-L-alanine amidase AmpD [Pseudomonadota bacterium]
MDASTGLLCKARQVRSPNFDARPAGLRPELIIVHGISLPPGKFGGPWIDRLFRNELPEDAHPYFAQVAQLKVSTHVLIRRDGKLVQYVSFNDRAWHAGRSSYLGREGCNDFSIGIELEGTDDRRYTRKQYVKLATLVDALCRVYPTLDRHRVVGHSDVAPGRKTDPGPCFDWPFIRSLIDAKAS